MAVLRSDPLVPRRNHIYSAIADQCRGVEPVSIVSGSENPHRIEISGVGSIDLTIHAEPPCRPIPAAVGQSPSA